MTPLERARDVMARYRAGKPDETPPLVRLIADAIEQAEKEARPNRVKQPDPATPDTKLAASR